MKFITKLTTLAIATTVLSATAAKAQYIFTVDVNTASIVDNSNGPYFLDFQLNAGSDSNTNSNTATISNFDYVNGSQVGGPSVGGDVNSVNNGQSLTLLESPAFTENDATLEFTPSTTNIIFTVDLSQNPGTVSPDTFTIDIYDNDGLQQTRGNKLVDEPNNLISTTAPNGTDLLNVNITGDNTLSDINTFVSVDESTSDTPGDGGSGGVTIVATPEPSSWILGLIAVGAGFYLRRSAVRA
jgi:hypothetical protein